MGNSLASGNKLYYQCSVLRPPHQAHRWAAAPRQHCWGPASHRGRARPPSGSHPAHWTGQKQPHLEVISGSAVQGSRATAAGAGVHLTGRRPAGGIATLQHHQPPHMLLLTSSSSGMDPSFQWIPYSSEGTIEHNED